MVEERHHEAAVHQVVAAVYEILECVVDRVARLSEPRAALGTPVEREFLAQLVGRRVGEDEDRGLNGVMDAGVAEHAFQVVLLDEQRRDEGHRSGPDVGDADRAVAGRREQVREARIEL